MLGQLRMYLAISTVFLLAAISAGCQGTGCQGGACHEVGSSTDPAYSLNHRSSGPMPTTVSEGAARGAVPATPTTPSPSRLPELNQTTQQLCPVTGAKLGSMGEPVAVVIGGQTVYVCCTGCVEKVEQDPEKYLRTSRASWSQDDDNVPSHDDRATNNVARLPADQPRTCNGSSCCH